MMDCIIVGGGVSGMFAAITAAGQGKKVLILEKNDCLGKKILITGNGRCNFTNEIVNPLFYSSEDNAKGHAFADKVLSECGNDKLLEMMSELGMSFYVREGYYYPKTDEAVTFRDTLINEINRLGIEVVYNYNLRSIKRTDSGFELSDKNNIYHGKKVILAMGGKAAPKTGSSGDAYYYLEGLGHKIIPPLPALTTLKTDYPTSLQGVNALADITLLIDDERIATEHGFIKYYKGMLSGIPIYQLSTRTAKAFNGKCKVEILVDFLADTNIDKAISRGLDERNALYQSINPKIVDAYYEEGNIQLFSSVKYEIIGYGDYNSAQCTSGGVDINEINPDTMESKVCPGLYITGELMDITGRCGGYNIQWAFSTGVIAGSNI